MDAGTITSRFDRKRAYPGYILAELEATVAKRAAGGEPANDEMIAEIAARKVNNTVRKFYA